MAFSSQSRADGVSQIEAPSEPSESRFEELDRSSLQSSLSGELERYKGAKRTTPKVWTRDGSRKVMHSTDAFGLGSLRQRE